MTCPMCGSLGLQRRQDRLTFLCSICGYEVPDERASRLETLAKTIPPRVMRDALLGALELPSGAKLHPVRGVHGDVFFEIKQPVVGRYSSKEENLGKENRKMLDIVATLKSLESERIDNDELVALSAGAKLLAGEYGTFGLDVPEWLREAQRALKVTIGERTRDFKMAELKKLKAKLEAKRADSQTVEDLEKKVASLSEQLGE